MYLFLFDYLKIFYGFAERYYGKFGSNSVLGFYISSMSMGRI